MIKELNDYQIVEKLSPDSITGYTGFNDREARGEINQLINSNLIPLIIFLIKHDRITDEEVLVAVEKFFEYLHYSKIEQRLDTEDKEELLSVIMNILRIIEKEYLPISFV